MRVGLGLAAAGLLAGGLVGLAPTSASAAYETVTTVHGAKLQACRATLGGDRAIRFRLDNRGARHAHEGGVFRNRGEVTDSFRVRASAGRLSGVKAVRLRAGDRLDSYVGEVDGPGAGGGFSRAELPRC
ncbi:hypothetical protein [Nocardioides sp. CFH 31398]|uniref:hypothetical protein n=1 Tax=Nocardioides sp. CFH 31398 TaxID=2919579 RepID=UPI001F0557D4|nr:hypothetical protein [Nocardioides sp. CFH 31398]MCH1864910.1 hypothetical protein [Nocardioides sp. CFH 31398]